ncbi:MAG: RecQ family ATP-dependent DNA helicase [Lentisphaerales bacterium]|nr:RecQ family ATP-dependent DNA helicase [Lentisphaerales bacterium]
MSELLTSSLKKYFGFDNFLEGQLEAISKVNEGNDICLVMPTGAGKSICYQLPVLLKPGYSIIISPLIALMKDQVDNLRAKGIPAVYVNSTQNEREQTENLAKVINGEAKMLYVAPERLRARHFKQMLLSHPPDCLIVDEAHCISQWGHDFRPDYARVGEFCEELNIKQVCAFTATATEIVREDIKVQLKRPDMDFLVTGFTRPNLTFKVEECNGNKREQYIRKALAEKVPTLIYCSSRKNVDELCSGFGIRGYHAGMSDKEREDAQNYFIEDACPVMVATNAFGMGIDRPDIRKVIHYNYPGSLEAYYQEAGRAGRDGEQSECVILYNFADKFIHEFLIELNNPGEKLVREVWQFLRGYAFREELQRLEISQTEISAHVSSAKSDQQISGALKILEKSQYIERGFRQQNKGSLKISGNLQELYQQHSNIRTQRSIFLARAIHYWRDQLASGLNVTYRELEQISGLNGDQVKRVLRALNGNEINWEVPFSGRSIVIKNDAPDIDIDFTELNKKADQDYDKLNKVLSYVQTRQCRQNFMISYFGQDEEDYSCQTCDRCQSSRYGKVELRKADLNEQKSMRIILRAAEKHSGYIGKVKLAAMLSGSTSKQIFDSKLNFSPFYGKLKQYDQTQIIEYIKSLEAFGYLEKSRGKYPTVEISERGEGALRGGEIRMEFAKRQPRKKKEGPLFAKKKKEGPLFGKPKNSDPEVIENVDEPEIVKVEETTAEEPQSDAFFGELFAQNPAPVKKEFSQELYEELRSLRNKVAMDSELQPFQIFNNMTLKELATQRPVSEKELLSIHGVNAQKVEQIGNAFLTLIQKYN